MKLFTPSALIPCGRWRVWCCLALLALMPPAALAAAEAGVISGTVSNAATGNLLEGAKVAVPGLARTAFTDETGRYVLAGVPAGTYELEVTYIGLDPVRASVGVTAGARAERNFDLTTGILPDGRVQGHRRTRGRRGRTHAAAQRRKREERRGDGFLRQPAEPERGRGRDAAARRGRQSHG
jgi:hypothetical protein